MEIYDIKIGESIKYEYKGSVEYNKKPYILKGIFYDINKEKTKAKFLGYYEGVQEFVYVTVRFTGSDSYEDKNKDGKHNVYMNINKMSKTKFKKEISDYLKKGTTLLANIEEINRKSWELAEKRDKSRDAFDNLYNPKGYLPKNN